MKVVIEISENDYWLACNHPETLIGVYAQAIKNGTPLPEGHGRVIDESKITKCEQIGLAIIDGKVTRCLITDAPTIVEADKK